MTLTAAQALAAVKIVPGGARELPSKISTVRFESIRISDARLFPGRYEAVLRRTENGKFGPLTVRQQDADAGAMQMQIRPGAEPEAVEFELGAERWALPVGPRVRWNEVRANGKIAGRVVEVSNFTLAGFFGVTTGTVFAASDVEAVITGFATASNIDVDAVLQTLRPQGQGTQEAPVSPLQGTAGLSLTILARGASFEDALGKIAVAGPFQVRWATLNGVNLGLAATQGATAAGMTRFTEFDGGLVASADGVRFEGVGGRAGAMAARADFTVGRDHSLSGRVRVELGGQTVQAPVTLTIGGTALDPRFGK
jgi:hypothetical protein